MLFSFNVMLYATQQIIILVVSSEQLLDSKPKSVLYCFSCLSPRGRLQTVYSHSIHVHGHFRGNTFGIVLIAVLIQGVAALANASFNYTKIEATRQNCKFSQWSLEPCFPAWSPITSIFRVKDLCFSGVWGSCFSGVQHKKESACIMSWPWSFKGHLTTMESCHQCTHHHSADVYRTSNTWYGQYLKLICGDKFIGSGTPWPGCILQVLH